MNRVFLEAGEGIAPGQEKTFTWTVIAPSTPETYNFQWRILQEDVTWFGEFSRSVEVRLRETSGA